MCIGLAMSTYAQSPCANPNCDPVPTTDVCSDGTNTVTLTCDSSLANVIWYNSAGAVVGIGCDLVVDNSLVGAGMVGDSECFYYEADDTSNCPANSCCPVTVTVLNCMTCETFVDDVSCVGEGDGEAFVQPMNGVAPFTYLWSDGQTTGTAVDLSGGTYTVTVSDAAGGTAVCSAIVTEPLPLICTTSANPVSCFGAMDGMASVVAGGGMPIYTYQWDNGSTNATAIGLSAGLHTVTITDDAGCELICDVTVDSPPQLTCNIVSGDLLCNADLSGSLDLTVGGGTMPYTYDWSNDGPETPDDDTEDLATLASGTYDVTVTDANGCTVICSATVDEPPVLVCTAVGTDESDCAAADGSITVTAAGGTAAYTCLLYTSPSPRDQRGSRMPSSA